MTHSKVSESRMMAGSVAHYLNSDWKVYEVVRAQRYNLGTKTLQIIRLLSYRMMVGNRMEVQVSTTRTAADKPRASYR
jgi:hypothetical protein